MAIRWNDSHDGSPNLLGFDGQILAGQVARYDSVDGNGPGWVGYVHGHRVTGPCLDANTARAGVEAVWPVIRRGR
jgi:hypothetical protein